MIYGYKLNSLNNLKNFDVLLNKITLIDDYETIDFTINVFIVHIDKLEEIIDKVVKSKVIVIDDTYKLKNYLNVLSQNLNYYIPIDNIEATDLDFLIQILLPTDAKLTERLVVDSQLNKIIISGETINLTSKEMEVFEYLNNNKDKLCLRKSILVDVLKYHPSSDSRIVDVYIRYIRNKLGMEGKKIKTIRGKGYVYETS